MARHGGAPLLFATIDALLSAATPPSEDSASVAAVPGVVLALAALLQQVPEVPELAGLRWVELQGRLEGVCSAVGSDVRMVGGAEAARRLGAAVGWTPGR